MRFLRYNVNFLDPGPDSLPCRYIDHASRTVYMASQKVFISSIALNWVSRAYNVVMFNQTVNKDLIANKLYLRHNRAEVAERTNAAGSRPVLPSGKLGFKSLPRRTLTTFNAFGFISR